MIFIKDIDWYFRFYRNTLIFEFDIQCILVYLLKESG